MVAGGKPLWYLEMLTTFSIFFLTVFFAGVLGSWSAGLARVIDNPKEHLDHFPPDQIPSLVKNFQYLRHTITGATFYFNLCVGSVAAISGALFGYLLYKEKVKSIYGMVWFGIVCSFTIVWMVTSVIFYVDLEEVASRIKVKTSEVDDLSAPISTIRKWGKDNSTSTVLGLIVGPTAGFLFLCFVAYRLNSKLEVFGNLNPDMIVVDETHPGSWFERKTGAEGGTWERESPAQIVEGEPLMEERKSGKFPLLQRVEEAVERKQGSLREDDVLTTDASPVVGGNPDGQEMITKEEQQQGWGNWLEDVFDYTF
jgi:hypothetical protein